MLQHPDEAKRIEDCAVSVAAIAEALRRPRPTGAERWEDGDYIRRSLDRIENLLASGRVSPSAVQIAGVKAQELATRYWRDAGKGRLPPEETQEAEDAQAPAAGSCART